MTVKHKYGTLLIGETIAGKWGQVLDEVTIQLTSQCHLCIGRYHIFTVDLRAAMRQDVTVYTLHGINRHTYTEFRKSKLSWGVMNSGDVHVQ